ncbi:MAG: glutamine synthetase family protein, partial [Candidatus Paceibacterota bacterium]
MNENNNLTNFLSLAYDELERRNLSLLDEAFTKSSKRLERERLAKLKKQDNIKAVSLCFCDIEGRFHILDYDKKFFVKSYDNLTFDGSSVRGFSELAESDLRIKPDWASLRFLPADVFSVGKVLMFATICTADRKLYMSDFRGELKEYIEILLKKDRVTPYMSTEIEGFLVEGVHAEQRYADTEEFKLISRGGYFHSLPLDTLRAFIDKSAEAQRALGFRNEKDHPEVAPSQFELNFSYAHVLQACDQVLLYKFVCRQIANSMGMTATFLPKPIANINGSGMHVNFSLAKNGKNLFYKKGGEGNLSNMAWSIIYKLLNHAPELTIILNSSVNGFRRLDPNFEAPNQIKVSEKDRGSMIRIPIGNEKSARLELRSVGPDANPYLLAYAVLKTAYEGNPLKTPKNRRTRVRYLPSNIHDALRIFKASGFTDKILGKQAKNKYAGLKQAAADRSPKDLGAAVKRSE